jgi:hypothetical protein
MNAQVFGKFGDGENLFVRGHNSSFIPPGQKLMCVSLVIANSMVFVAGTDVKQTGANCFRHRSRASHPHMHLSYREGAN